MFHCSSDLFDSCISDGGVEDLEDSNFFAEVTGGQSLVHRTLSSRSCLGSLGSIFTKIRDRVSANGICFPARKQLSRCISGA